MSILARMRAMRMPHLSLSMLCWMAAIWFATAYNFPLWQQIGHLRGGFSAANLGFVAVLWLLIIFFFNAMLNLLLWPRLSKALLFSLCIASAMVAYYIGHYGVLIDSTMIQNAVQTDVREVRDLISPAMIVFVFLLGVLPALGLLRIRVRAQAWAEILWMKLGMFGLSCLLVIAGVYMFYPDMASLARNHRELRYMLVPSNYLYGTVRYIQLAHRVPEKIEVIGADAHRVALSGVQAHPRLTVLVVGETARADRFALNGYARDTNPRLSQEAVLNFPDVASCGTSTAVSLPCMFSGLTRQDYSDQKGRTRESLLDVLQRAGLNVQWRDNNSGCKGACDRVEHIDFSNVKNADYCSESECYDEVMINDLKAWMQTLKKDTVLVLHQKGSHGPAYYLRYPPAFEHFKPVCKTSDLEKCDQQAIGNAFDNTIRYTDYFLAQLIDSLKQSSLDSAMLYVSDHGESLGENNVYLHGTPYAIAPETQKKVPMIAWFSQGYSRQAQLDMRCLNERRQQPYSHDYLYHSVLGLLDVKTSVYQSSLDMFAPCRPKVVL